MSYFSPFDGRVSSAIASDSLPALYKIMEIFTEILIGISLFIISSTMGMGILVIFVYLIDKI